MTAMLDTVREYLRARKYGEPIVIVSGLPRSGTSMMMKMLDAGGMPPVTDGLRAADVDNPKGYFELERIKDLEKETDKSYVAQARGKALKVISFLLKDLPPDNYYQVVFMRRDLDEVILSQDKMIEHRQADDPTQAETLKEAYRNHIVSVRRMVRAAPNFALTEVHYREAIKTPQSVAEQVNLFLGGRLDVRKMVEAVDPALYRNRRD
jgi:hypothetical protein